MKKVFLSLLLALTAICGLLGFAACGETNHLKFTSIDNSNGQSTYSVQYDNSDNRIKVKKVEVPETYQGGKVTVIMERAFYNCGSLEEVTIPNSIEKICSEAFQNTRLYKINYQGTKGQWDNIEKESDWKVATSMGLTLLKCTDGEYRV